MFIKHGKRIIVSKYNEIGQKPFSLCSKDNLYKQIFNDQTELDFISKLL